MCISGSDCCHWLSESPENPILSARQRDCYILQYNICESIPGEGQTTGAAGQRLDCRTVPASVNDQWNFLLKTVWDQMIHLVIRFEGQIDLPMLDVAVREALLAEPLSTAKFTRESLRILNRPVLIPECLPLP